MPVRYETERLIVRDFVLEDAADIFQTYRHEEVQRWLHGTPVPSVEVMQEKLAGIIEKNAGKDRGAWAVELRETGVVVGTSLLKNLPNDERVEVGWHLNPEYWGKGIATEFGRGAIEYGFEKLGLNEIYAVLLPDNERSRRVALKCGLELQGLTERYYDVQLEIYCIGSGARFG